MEKEKARFVTSKLIKTALTLVCLFCMLVVLYFVTRYLISFYPAPKYNSELREDKIVRKIISNNESIAVYIICEDVYYSVDGERCFINNLNAVLVEHECKVVNLDSNSVLQVLYDIDAKNNIVVRNLSEDVMVETVMEFKEGETAIYTSRGTIDSPIATNEKPDVYVSIPQYNCLYVPYNFVETKCRYEDIEVAKEIIVLYNSVLDSLGVSENEILALSKLYINEFKKEYSNY